MLQKKTPLHDVPLQNTRRVAVYARVGTAKQLCPIEVQKHEILRYFESFTDMRRYGYYPPCEGQ